MIPDIRIEDYNYILPDERIAKYPLPERDSSKLLVYKDGACSDHVFNEIPDMLPDGALMVFNDTKVVPARLFFKRDTGAVIEVFCLEPVLPADYASIFNVTSSCRWKCVIGNAKKWKGDVISAIAGADMREYDLKAELIERTEQTGVVEFCWKGDIPFSRVLELCGKVPIPPYLNRETEDLDLERYQTLYAHIRGSVAAPTAGLHFTDKVLDGISNRGIQRDTVCLHVGAGTFLPVKTSAVAEHTMHREPFIVTRTLLQRLIQARGKVIAVGTTSVRTLESLYYTGVSCIEKGCPELVEQWAPYVREYPYSLEESLKAILDWLDRNNLEQLETGTRIIIVPGFRFRVVDVLVTNFHQPQSTLLLLISAFTGGDWKTIYRHALDGGYRFLSYGDSSLLFRR